MSALPPQPVSAARTGIVSFSFPYVCTEPGTVFGSSTVPWVLGKHLSMGLASGGRSGLAVRMEFRQRPDVAASNCSLGKGWVTESVCRTDMRGGQGRVPIKWP